MNLKKCENGHFFDNNNFDECPHCVSKDESMKIPEK